LYLTVYGRDYKVDASGNLFIKLIENNLVSVI